ncbi:MAG: 3-hydroxyisobutyrate dehydrogenase, partial [Alphaproteobacteria bacterium]|nr:3-hydroxyisobutyrate dehydrogenase [Alphaproteobacteria bacterium]
MKIGFIGVGNMGGPMARNLLKAGDAVTAFDVSPEAVAAVVAEGAVAADTPAAAVDGAEMVITMLPAGAHVREVYCGDGGVVAAAPPGAVLIDCSTIDVDSAREVANSAAAAGLAMLDAPVSGGVAGASAAALTFMVGGDAAAFAKAEPVLAKMGRKIVHAGPSGNGQAAKICNNMILGISMIALGEAFTLADSLGLEAQTLFDISSNASGSCWAMLNHLPVAGIVETAAANQDFAPGFATDMMLKDLRLAQQAANASGAA